MLASVIMLASLRCMPAKGPIGYIERERPVLPLRERRGDGETVTSGVAGTGVHPPVVRSDADSPCTTADAPSNPGAPPRLPGRLSGPAPGQSRKLTAAR